MGIMWIAPMLSCGSVFANQGVSASLRWGCEGGGCAGICEQGVVHHERVVGGHKLVEDEAPFMISPHARSSALVGVIETGHRAWAGVPP